MSGRLNFVFCSPEKHDVFDVSVTDALDHVYVGGDVSGYADSSLVTDVSDVESSVTSRDSDFVDAVIGESVAWEESTGECVWCGVCVCSVCMCAVCVCVCVCL